MNYYLVAFLDKGLKAYARSDVYNNMVREQARRERITPEHVCPKFSIVDEPKYRELKAEDNAAKLARATANRKKGAEKRNKRAAERVARGLPPKKFVTCPTCNAKSKLIRTEMGGLQTRTCQNGHHFEVDMFFGHETYKRRVERTDRPLFVGGNYVDYVLGKYKNDPSGEQDK